MRLLLLLVALGLAVAAAVPTDPQKIVGGSLTTINAYPTIAALLYSSNLITYWQGCGGTILNSRSILTAAHCTINSSAGQWRSRVGSSFASSGGTVLATSSILNHPSYNPRTYDSDISIIRTAATIVYSTTVQPASIAGSNYNLGDNQVVWAAGWGATSSGGPTSEQLRHVQIWTVNQAVCAARYAGYSITANMLCSGWLDVGGRDQCQNDSGGPLYHPNNNVNVVVGVCSWGIGCAQAWYPGVNARVSSFTTWIQSNA